MADTSRGTVATTLLRASIAGKSFPSGVPNTPENRSLWESIQADIASLPDGVAPDVPWDYNDSDGGGDGGTTTDPGDASPPASKASTVTPADLAAFLAKRKFDRDVGGGVDRDQIPAEDFAGRGRSFPIVTPKDVHDAAASIGRAGDDNDSPDQLRANITRIARRKGPQFVAQLPDSWRDKEGKAMDTETDKVSEPEAEKKGKPFPGAHEPFGKNDDEDKASEPEAEKSKDDDADDGDGDSDGGDADNDSSDYDDGVDADNDEKPKQSTKAAKPRRKCPKCEGFAKARHKFCPKCGASMSAKPEVEKGARTKPTPAGGVTGEHADPVPAHREPDGDAIEAFEADAKLPTDPDRSLEEKTADRLKSVGAPYDLGALHDLLCPAYDPDIVGKAYPHATLTALDVDTWQAKAFDAATSAPLDEAQEATHRWQHAVTIKSTPVETLDELRWDAFKSFTDANQGPGSAPTPGDISPARFNRPYITAGHEAPSPGQGAPNHAPVPSNHGLDATDYNRGPLTAGQESDSPDNSHTQSNAAAPSLTGKPSRTYYTNSLRDSARAAMSALHDHIAQSFPDICSLRHAPGDSGGTPANVGAVSATGKSEEAPEVIKAAVPETSEDVAKGITPDLIKSAVDSALSSVHGELAQLRKENKRLRKQVDQLADLPDPSVSAFRGMAVGTDVAKALTPVQADTVAKAAHDAQLQMRAALTEQWRESPSPEQREAAWRELLKMNGLPS